MKIPSRGLEKFVRDIADNCLASQNDRINRGSFYKNYALYGAESPENCATFNKTFAYLDDLESLLYSPASLRFHIGDLDVPNIVNEAKGRAAAAKLRQMFRAADVDTAISEAVYWSLVKGKSFLKLGWQRDSFHPTLIQPEQISVLYEQHTKLDQNMEAFVHSMIITPYQFRRMIANKPDAAELERKAKRYMSKGKLGLLGLDNTQKQITVGGLYPFQPSGSNSPNNTKGIVDWLGGPTPGIAPNVVREFMQLDEVWVWDDERVGWATFQIVGDDMLLWGKYFRANIMAYDTQSCREEHDLIDKHPFCEFCANRLDGYFFGRSEVANVALLQEAINSRINGTNKLLRLEESPPKRFIGSSGVNQQALARFSKPDGYWVDGPNAKVDTMPPQMPKDMWGSLHEFERMFDEMGGLPPVAKGHGEAGVRSAGHAETLVRMFTPRFKDRALLIERDVEGVGALALDLARAHVSKQMVAWVPQDAAGIEGGKPDPAIVPPVPGTVAVKFGFADLDDDVTLTVDAHSSSPAFAQDAKSLAFDLLKIGAMSAEDVVEHTDSPSPEELLPGIQRRNIARAQAAEQQEALKAFGHKGK